MAGSFHPLNHPSHSLGFISRHRSQNTVRRSPVLALPPSSIVPNTEENGNLPDFRKSSHSNSAPRDGNSSGSLLAQCNSVGVIGGVSVVSTLNFVKKLVKWSSKNEENSNIPFVLCSDPVLSKELLLHGRSSFPSLASKGEHLARDHGPIVSNLRNKRIFLENSGAGGIVMPCHISHSWYDEVAEGCSVPFLHMGECVAKELKEAKLKPLEAGSPLRIGIIATEATLAAGFYQEKLQNEGFEVVVPDKATMEHTVVPAVEALIRNDIEGAQNLLRIALQVLLVRAVNTIILASDEMQDLLPPDDPLLKKCVDPMDALVRSTIKHARSADRETENAHKDVYGALHRAPLDWKGDLHGILVMTSVTATNYNNCKIMVAALSSPRKCNPIQPPGPNHRKISIMRTSEKGYAVHTTSTTTRTIAKKEKDR